MSVLRDLEWRAILSGFGALVLASILIPLVQLLVAIAVPHATWLQVLFIWLNDTQGGRALSSLSYILIGSAVAYRMSNDRKVLHGCLAPVLLFIGLSVVMLVVSVFTVGSTP